MYFTPLRTEKIGLTDRGVPLYRLTDDFVFESKFAANGDGELRIRVPAGFKTDYASTPWYLWWWLPRDGAYAEAAVIHDYLYANGRKVGVSRYAADAFLMVAMEALKIKRARRWVIYLAVRLFGGRYYQ